MTCSNKYPQELSVDIINTFISDHTGQLCTVHSLNSNTPNITKEVRQFTKNSITLLRFSLQQETWDDVYSSDDVETSYNNFIGTINYNLNIACPYKKCKTKNSTRPLLFDQETKHKKEKFIEAHKAFLTTGSEQTKVEAALKKKEYDIHIKATKKHQIADFVNKADDKPKAMWYVINKERSCKSTKSEVSKLEKDGQTIMDPMKIVEQLNAYFVNISAKNVQSGLNTNQSLNTQTQHQQQTAIEDLILWPTNHRELRKIIMSMKAKTSSGFDDISSSLLKTLENELVHPLNDIINKSFKQSVVPTQLKLAKVYPKYKKGSKTQAENYRPISLLPTFSKIMEKVVLSRLLEHLKRNNLLAKEQHGFTADRSTTTAITSTVEYIIKAYEEGDTTMAIFLDYTKAFDSICHERLLNKLTKMGIRGKAAQWFRSYLQGRTQAVQIKTTNTTKTVVTTSNPLPVLKGVPQGSVLGPILYIIFVSDFQEHMEGLCKSLLYADDTVLLLKNKTPAQLEIQAYTSMNMAKQYCQTNCLHLNENKSQQLTLGRRKAEVEHLPELETVDKVRYLGIIIDDKLTWTEHINQLCKKLSSALYVLRRLKTISTTNMVRTAYYALFETHIRYGLLVWGGASKANVQRVLLLQKKAIRILTGLGPQDSCREAFVQQKILTILSLYILETGLHAFKQNPRRSNDTHTHNTRAANNYALPAHRLKAYETHPTYAGSKFLNNMPEEVKEANNLKQLRKKMTNWLLSRPFYTLDEFSNWRRREEEL